MYIHRVSKTNTEKRKTPEMKQNIHLIDRKANCHEMSFKLFKTSENIHEQSSNEAKHLHLGKCVQ